jgi:5S rRNA maturation endonuclease (ribonuclease M5)
MSNVAEIKSRHSISSVLASNGVEVKGAMAVCPFHEDNNPSFSIYDDGEKWKCFAGCGYGDVIDLLAKFDGKTSSEYLKNGSDIIAKPQTKPLVSNRREPKNEKLGPVVAKYEYPDQTGKLVFEIRRHEPKTFRPYRIENGKPILGMGNVSPIPYQLPLVVGAETIIIVEGERDADTLLALGYVATCNPFGAGKWDTSWGNYFTGKDIILCGDNDDPGRRHIDQIESALKLVAKTVKRVVVPSPSKDISDYLAEMTDTEARAAVEELLRQSDPMDALLDARRFDLANPPARPVPVLSIDSKTIATAGNVVGITSQAKAGTTALIAAMMAALMEPSGDCLGITGQNPDGLPVVHFDCEQSAFDHHAVGLQILNRAGRQQEPEWLRSYRLADVPTKDRRKALAHDMKRAAIGGKLRAVFLDGIADLCIDPNDSAEAFGLVEELHRLAITFDCPIFCRLHENPGTETGKTRGHLGSQLERKAETNLRLSKDTTGVTTIYTERSRHCHIPKESGPRFAWDDAAGMHLSRGPGNVEKENAKAKEITGILTQVFKEKPLLSYSELRTAIMQIRGITQRPAEKYIASLQPKFIHQTASGLYEVKP